jgi:uncharacterized membrane protein
MSDDAAPAPHLETTVQAIAKVHADHHRSASPLQRLAERATARAGRPASLFALLILVLVWIVLNLIVEALGGRPPDPPPFSFLQGLLALGALCMTVLILTTQRRENQIAESREQLTLELAVLSEQKITKVIQLLEEIRRDAPFLPNRRDDEAAALGVASDPQMVLEAIREAHAAAILEPQRMETPEPPKAPSERSGVILNDSP